MIRWVFPQNSILPTYLTTLRITAESKNLEIGNNFNHFPQLFVVDIKFYLSIYYIKLKAFEKLFVKWIRCFLIERITS